MGVSWDYDLFLELDNLARPQIVVNDPQSTIFAFNCYDSPASQPATGNGIYAAERKSIKDV